MSGFLSVIVGFCKMTSALDYAFALSTPLQGIIYGFSIYMFGVTCATLLQRRRSSGRINIVMITTACLLFILSSVHMGIDIYRNIRGLVEHRDTPGGPPAYFIGGGNSSWFFLVLIYGIETLIGDVIVIYRCYVVWSSFWIISVPVLLWLATFCLGVTGLWKLLHDASLVTVSFPQWPNRVSDAFFATTLVCNGLATGLLSYRLWTVNRETSKYYCTVDKTLIHIARVVIDSGAIYSISVLLVLILQKSPQSSGSLLTFDLVAPVIPLCFYMIIIRVTRREMMSCNVPKHCTMEINTSRVAGINSIEIIDIRGAEQPGVQDNIDIISTNV